MGAAGPGTDTIANAWVAFSHLQRRAKQTEWCNINNTLADTICLGSAALLVPPTYSSYYYCLPFLRDEPPAAKVGVWDVEQGSQWRRTPLLILAIEGERHLHWRGHPSGVAECEKGSVEVLFYGRDTQNGLEVMHLRGERSQGRQRG